MLARIITSVSRISTTSTAPFALWIVNLPLALPPKPAAPALKMRSPPADPLAPSCPTMDRSVPLPAASDRLSRNGASPPTVRVSTPPTLFVDNNSGRVAEALPEAEQSEPVGQATIRLGVVTEVEAAMVPALTAPVVLMSCDPASIAWVDKRTLSAMTIVAALAVKIPTPFAAATITRPSVDPPSPAPACRITSPPAEELAPFWPRMMRAVPALLVWFGLLRVKSSSSPRSI